MGKRIGKRLLLLPTLMDSATPPPAETSAIGAAGGALVPLPLPTSTDVRGPARPSMRAFGVLLLLKVTSSTLLV
jgi:hypothetical protein